MEAESVIAFRAPTEETALEVRVNFGVFNGREATAAELEELAQMIVPELGEVTIVAEQRHEVGEHAEASLHQVRIEVAREHAPAKEDARELLAGRLVAVAESWMLLCSAARHTEISG